jgi:hypothetical protein
LKIREIGHFGKNENETTQKADGFEGKWKLFSIYLKDRLRV